MDHGYSDAPPPAPPAHDDRGYPPVRDSRDEPMRSPPSVISLAALTAHPTDLAACMLARSQPRRWQPLRRTAAQALERSRQSRTRSLARLVHLQLPLDSQSLGSSWGIRAIARHSC